jgi:hypothetical protein
MALIPAQSQTLVGVGTWRCPGGKRGADAWRGHDSAGRSYCTDLKAEPETKRREAVVACGCGLEGRTDGLVMER